MCTKNKLQLEELFNVIYYRSCRVCIYAIPHTTAQTAFVNDIADIQLCQAPVSITKLTGTLSFHPPLEISFEYHLVEKVSLLTNERIEVFQYNTANIESAFDYLYALIDGVTM